MSTPDFKNLPLVYIAGPYTNPDPVRNTHDTVVFADQLATEGWCTPVIPHLSMLWHSIRPHDEIEWWYEYDLAMLARCDAMYRLPGASSGADAEERFALERRIPVFYDATVMFAHLRHG